MFPHTPEVPPPTFSRRPPSFYPCPCLAPWQPCVSALLAAAEGAFLASLLPARASTCSPPAPLSCVTHDNAVRVSPLLLGSPSVISSSSVSSEDSLSLPPLHPSLSASLPPCPSRRRSPLSPSVLTCVWWSCCLRFSSAVVLPLAIFLRPVFASPRGRPQASLFRPPAPARLPPSSRGPLLPLALHLALLPPALDRQYHM